MQENALNYEYLVRSLFGGVGVVQRHDLFYGDADNFRGAERTSAIVNQNQTVENVQDNSYRLGLLTATLKAGIFVYGNEHDIEVHKERLDEIFDNLNEESNINDLIDTINEIKELLNL